MKNNSIFEPKQNKKKKLDKIKGVKNIAKNSGYLHEWREVLGKKRNKRLKGIALFGIALILTVSITVFINIQDLNQIRRERDQFLIQITPVPAETEVKTTAEPMEYSSEFERARKMYSDVVGYLVIPDTNIDFPIVQGEDDFFFENRNYDRTYSEIAATYMLTDCDIDTSRHIVIYGENSELEGRFGELNSFLDYDFFYNHEYITLELEDGAQVWQVFAVHLASTTFNYKDIDFEDNIEYLAYIKMFQTMSRFERDINLSEKDQIVTLVTDYHDLDLEAGYLLVHARRIN